MIYKPRLVNRRCYNRRRGLMHYLCYHRNVLTRTISGRGVFREQVVREDLLREARPLHDWGKILERLFK